MSEIAGKPAETVAEKTVREATLGAPTSKRKSPQRRHVPVTKPAPAEPSARMGPRIRVSK